MTAADHATITLGEIVRVRTPHHDGARAQVVEIADDKRGASKLTHGRYARSWVRLKGINGSLDGAEGWYELREIERAEDGA